MQTVSDKDFVGRAGLDHWKISFLISREEAEVIDDLKSMILCEDGATGIIFKHIEGINKMAAVSSQLG